MYAECFDKVLYHVNSRILKCKMMNVITRFEVYAQQGKVFSFEGSCSSMKYSMPINIDFSIVLIINLVEDWTEEILKLILI
jgi:hypothetical protein